MCLYFWWHWFFIALVRAFSNCGEQGLHFVAVHGLWQLLLLRSAGPRRAGPALAAAGPQSAGSEVVAHRLDCSSACGIFPDPGLNLCLPR